MFWLWRVSKIRIYGTGGISGAVNDGVDVHTDSYSFAFDFDVACPKRDPFFYFEKTEFDQLTERQRFSNQLAPPETPTPGVIADQFETVDGNPFLAFQLRVNWCASCFHLPEYPIDEGWVIHFDFAMVVQIPSTEVPVGGTFSQFFTSSGFTGSVNIQGEDAVFGNLYNHVIPGFWNVNRYTGADPPDPGASGVTGTIAALFIEPKEFYEYKDSYTAAPLYNKANGHLLEPFP